MEAIEFWAHVGDDRTLAIPAEVAGQLRKDQQVRVILLLNDDGDEDHAWNRLASEQLLRAYGDEDSIYDAIELPAR